MEPSVGFGPSSGGNKRNTRLIALYHVAFSYGLIQDIGLGIAMNRGWMITVT